MCTNPVQLAGGAIFACGKCFECCVAYSNMWAQRCMDEAKLHTDNCFITLTYEKTDGELHKDDLQKFIKRLRKRIMPIKIRYFACGEYGSKRNRPHYHMVIFGWKPPDMIYVTTKKGIDYYGSKFVEEVWRSNEKAWNDGRQGGFISVTQVAFRSCRYCAKYLQKLDERPHSVSPFTVMSRRPGIGTHSVSESMLLTGLTYYNGKSYPIPRFYVDKLKQQGYNVDILKAKRQYVYQHKYGTFTDLSVVDSARKRGEVHSKMLKHGF